jgi:hypothetical protein
LEGRQAGKKYSTDAPVNGRKYNMRERLKATSGRSEAGLCFKDISPESEDQEAVGPECLAHVRRPQGRRWLPVGGPSKAKWSDGGSEERMLLVEKGHRLIGRGWTLSAWLGEALRGFTKEGCDVVFLFYGDSSV